MEHYRLWFEFLKLALRDPALKGKINTAYYADWGDVASSDFDEWWVSHWRQLFSVPLNVVEVHAGSETAHAALSSNRIVLSIDPAAGLEKTLNEVKELLRARTASMPRKKIGLTQKGRFAIDGVTELRRLNMQQALKVYALSLENDDIDDIVSRYIKWVVSWEAKPKGWNGRKLTPPSTFKNYSADKEKGERKLDNQRRPIRRLLQRGRAIAANVAIGKFPGRYS